MAQAYVPQQWKVLLGNAYRRGNRTTIQERQTRKEYSECGPTRCLSLRFSALICRALRDLPLDMAEIVDVLSRHTGAHFYMAAGYHGGGNEALIYE